MDEAMRMPSSWLDTHPSLSERLASARQEPRLGEGVRSAGEELFGNAWTALLAEFNKDGFFPVHAEIDLRSGRLEASVRGGRFDPSQHQFFTELKAVTQHALIVRHADGGRLEAEVIFDV